MKFHSGTLGFKTLNLFSFVCSTACIPIKPNVPAPPPPTKMPAQFNTISNLPKHHCNTVNKREISSYVNLCVTKGYPVIQFIKGKHPWITGFAFNSNMDEELLFRIDLFWTHQNYVETYPFETKHTNANLAKNTVNHFMTHRIDVFLENEWSHDVVASINAPGVIRAMVFQS